MAGDDRFEVIAIIDDFGNCPAQRLPPLAQGRFDLGGRGGRGKRQLQFYKVGLHLGFLIAAKLKFVEFVFFLGGNL
jgi:hypothetical protein